MTQTEQILARIRPELTTLRKRFGVKTLGLFGSWARGEASPQSDVDLLVEFEKTSFDAYMGVKFYLEDHLGRPVDLVIRRSLKPSLRERVLQEVQDVA
jgi:predicted nucleotidyltransferase